MVTRDLVMWNIHDALGIPHNVWGITDAEILENIQKKAMPLFSKYYPYFTEVLLGPAHKTNRPGVYKIPIADMTNIISIGRFHIKNYSNTRDGMSSGAWDGGYPAGGGTMNNMASIDNLNSVNQATTETPYEFNVQFMPPCYVKVDPVNVYRYIEGVLEVKLRHDMTFRTIDDGLLDIFLEICILAVKDTLYNKYRYLKDGILNGVNISADISDWADARNEIKEWKGERKANFYKHRSRMRANYFVF